MNDIIKTIVYSLFTTLSCFLGVYGVFFLSMVSGFRGFGVVFILLIPALLAMQWMFLSDSRRNSSFAETLKLFLFTYGYLLLIDVGFGLLLGGFIRIFLSIEEIRIEEIRVLGWATFFIFCVLCVFVEALFLRKFFGYSIRQAHIQIFFVVLLLSALSFIGVWSQLMFR